ncbi:hypothetical protein F4680DRAFT_442294 [Xylaria scruposa]|nr:hypothetical protein F4680DRAFT_442294 [Xylaria scruposa]
MAPLPLPDWDEIARCFRVIADQFQRCNNLPAMNDPGIHTKLNQTMATIDTLEQRLKESLGRLITESKEDLMGEIKLLVFGQKRKELTSPTAILRIKQFPTTVDEFNNLTYAHVKRILTELDDPSGNPNFANEARARMRLAMLVGVQEQRVPMIDEQDVDANFVVC